MRRLILIWSIISTIFCPATATAADLILDGQSIVVVDPKGTSKTVQTRSAFMLTRIEFEKATLALSEYQEQKKLLAAAGIQHDNVIGQLLECQNEVAALKVKLSKRTIWIITTGSTCLAIGVVTGVLVR